LIAVILAFKIEGCGIIRDYNSLELGCSVLPERRLRLGGAGAQLESFDRYSYGRVNCHISCVDQEDH